MQKSDCRVFQNTMFFSILHLPSLVWIGVAVFISLLLSLQFGTAASGSVEQVPRSTLSNVSAFSKSDTEDIFAIADVNGGVYLWDASKSDERRVLDDGLIVTNSYGPSIMWSPDGRLVGAQTSQGAYIWDTETMEVKNHFDGHPITALEGLSQSEVQGVTDIAFSPDNELFATAHSYDKTVLLWDLRTGEIFQQITVEGYQNGIQRIQFSQDGRKVVTLAWETVDVWNVQTGELIFSVDIAAEGAAISTDGTLLAAGTGGFFSQIYVWDVATGILRAQLEAPMVIQELKWISDDHLLVGRLTDFSLAHDGFVYTGMAVRTWNIEAETSAGVFELVSERGISYQLGEHETLVGVGIGQLDGKEVLIWNRETGDVYRRDTVVEQDTSLYPVTSSKIISFALNADDSQLLTGSSDGLVAIWDFQSKQLLSSFSTENAIIGVDWLLEKNVIVTLSENRNLVLWEVP
jgi:WD40 repeat protein